MILFCGENLSFFLFFKVGSNMVKGTFFENCHIPRKKAMKLPRFLEDFQVFLLKSIQIIGSTSSLTTCNMISRFSIPLFVLQPDFATSCCANHHLWCNVRQLEKKLSYASITWLYLLEPIIETWSIWVIFFNKNLVYKQPFF